MYRAIDLSKYIVHKCIEDGYPITNLQLQKILYYIQKEFLKCGKLAFPDEIEAWQFGPVVPNVYYYYCGYGAMPIASLPEGCNFTPVERDMVDSLIENKRVLQPWDLVADAHKQNGAWCLIYANGTGNHKPIPINLIQTCG